MVPPTTISTLSSLDPSINVTTVSNTSDLDVASLLRAMAAFLPMLWEAAAAAEVLTVPASFRLIPNESEDGTVLARRHLGVPIEHTNINHMGVCASNATERFMNVSTEETNEVCDSIDEDPSLLGDRTSDSGNNNSQNVMTTLSTLASSAADIVLSSLAAAYTAAVNALTLPFAAESSTESVDSSDSNVRFNNTTAGIALAATLTSDAAQPRSLRIFGKPGLWQVRGVGYQPTPPGATPFFSPHDRAGDYYAQRYAALHRRDLALMRRAGVNAIRLWGWSEAVSHLSFLDLAYNNGVDPIYVIPTFQPDYGVPSGSFDVSDDRPAQWRRVEERWAAQLRRYQHHPALLMWLVGNEPNRNAKTLPAFMRLVTRLSTLRDKLCPDRPKTGDNSTGNVGAIDDGSAEYSESALGSRRPNFACWHPVSVPLGEVSRNSTLMPLLSRLERRYPRAVDLYSLQLFRGSSFGLMMREYSHFQTLSAMGTVPADAPSRGGRRARSPVKPLLITEFGMDALDFRRGSGEVNERMQAAAVAALWGELEHSRTLPPGPAGSAYDSAGASGGAGGWIDPPGTYYSGSSGSSSSSSASSSGGSNMANWAGSGNDVTASTASSSSSSSGTSTDSATSAAASPDGSGSTSTGGSGFADSSTASSSSDTVSTPTPTVRTPRPVPMPVTAPRAPVRIIDTNINSASSAYSGDSSSSSSSANSGGVSASADYGSSGLSDSSSSYSTFSARSDVGHANTATVARVSSVNSEPRTMRVMRALSHIEDMHDDSDNNANDSDIEEPIHVNSADEDYDDNSSSNIDANDYDNSGRNANTDMSDSRVSANDCRHGNRNYAGDDYSFPVGVTRASRSARAYRIVHTLPADYHLANFDHGANDATRNMRTMQAVPVAPPRPAVAPASAPVSTSAPRPIAGSSGAAGRPNTPSPPLELQSARTRARSNNTNANAQGPPRVWPVWTGAPRGLGVGPFFRGGNFPPPPRVAQPTAGTSQPAAPVLTHGAAGPAAWRHSSNSRIGPGLTRLARVPTSGAGGLTNFARGLGPGGDRFSGGFGYGYGEIGLGFIPGGFGYGGSGALGLGTGGSGSGGGAGAGVGAGTFSVRDNLRDTYVEDEYEDCVDRSTDRDLDHEDSTDIDVDNDDLNECGCNCGNNHDDYSDTDNINNEDRNDDAIVNGFVEDTSGTDLHRTQSDNFSSKNDATSMNGLDTEDNNVDDIDTHENTDTNILRPRGRVVQPMFSFDSLYTTSNSETSIYSTGGDIVWGPPAPAAPPARNARRAPATAAGSGSSSSVPIATDLSAFLTASPAAAYGGAVGVPLDEDDEGGDAALPPDDTGAFSAPRVRLAALPVLTAARYATASDKASDNTAGPLALTHAAGTTAAAAWARRDPLCVGGVLMEWNDEWWRASLGSLPLRDGCPSTDPGLHAVCGEVAFDGSSILSRAAAAALYGDNVAGNLDNATRSTGDSGGAVLAMRVDGRGGNEKKDKLDREGSFDNFYSAGWMGIVGHTNEAGDCIAPRLAYHAMAGMFTGSLRWDACDNGRCCAHGRVEGAYVAGIAIVAALAVLISACACARCGPQGDSESKNKLSGLTIRGKSAWADGTLWTSVEAEAFASLATALSSAMSASSNSEINASNDAARDGSKRAFPPMLPLLTEHRSHTLGPGPATLAASLHSTQASVGAAALNALMHPLFAGAPASAAAALNSIQPPNAAAQSSGQAPHAQSHLSPQPQLQSAVTVGAEAALRAAHWRLSLFPTALAHTAAVPVASAAVLAWVQGAWARAYAAAVAEHETAAQTANNALPGESLAGVRAYIRTAAAAGDNKNSEGGGRNMTATAHAGLSLLCENSIGAQNSSAVLAEAWSRHCSNDDAAALSAAALIKAIDTVHARVTESYLAWCDATGHVPRLALAATPVPTVSSTLARATAAASVPETKPLLAARAAEGVALRGQLLAFAAATVVGAVESIPASWLQLEDIAHWALLWTASEALRRVPAVINARFHERHLPIGADVVPSFVPLAGADSDAASAAGVDNSGNERYGPGGVATSDIVVRDAYDTAAEAAALAGMPVTARARLLDLLRFDSTPGFHGSSLDDNSASNSASPVRYLRLQASGLDLRTPGMSTDMFSRLSAERAAAAAALGVDGADSARLPSGAKAVKLHGGATAAPAWYRTVTAAKLKSVDAHTATFDDLDDTAAEIYASSDKAADAGPAGTGKTRGCCGVMPRVGGHSVAYPAAGGWPALLLLYANVIRLHAWLCVAVVDVVRSRFGDGAGGGGGGWTLGSGFIQAAANHFTSESGVTTAWKIAVIDCVLALIFTLTHAVATRSLRFTALISMLVSVVCILVLGAVAPSSSVSLVYEPVKVTVQTVFFQFNLPVNETIASFFVERVFTLSALRALVAVFDADFGVIFSQSLRTANATTGPLPTAQGLVFAIQYVILAVAVTVLFYIVTFTVRSSSGATMLPGAARLEDRIAAVPWSRHRAGASILLPPGPDSGPAPRLRRRNAVPGGAHTQRRAHHSGCARAGWTLRYVARTCGFFAVVIAIKLLFDAAVLWPSVTGVTMEMCSVRPHLGYSTVSLMLDRRTPSPVANANAAAAGPGVFGTLKTPVPVPSTSTSCALAITMMWVVTFAISLCTTYVAYIAATALFGALVPTVLAAAATGSRQTACARVFIAAAVAVLLSVTLTGAVAVALVAAAPVALLTLLLLPIFAAAAAAHPAAAQRSHSALAVLGLERLRRRTTASIRSAARRPCADDENAMGSESKAEVPLLAVDPWWVLRPFPHQHPRLHNAAVPVGPLTAAAALRATGTGLLLDAVKLYTRSRDARAKRVVSGAQQELTFVDVTITVTEDIGGVGLDRWLTMQSGEGVSTAAIAEASAVPALALLGVQPAGSWLRAGAEERHNNLSEADGVVVNAVTGLNSAIQLLTALHQLSLLSMKTAPCGPAALAQVQTRALAAARLWLALAALGPKSETGAASPALALALLLSVQLHEAGVCNTDSSTNSILSAAAVDTVAGSGNGASRMVRTGAHGTAADRPCEAAAAAVALTSTLAGLWERVRVSPNANTAVPMALADHLIVAGGGAIEDWCDSIALDSIVSAARSVVAAFELHLADAHALPLCDALDLALGANALREQMSTTSLNSRPTITLARPFAGCTRVDATTNLSAMLGVLLPLAASISTGTPVTAYLSSYSSESASSLTVVSIALRAVTTKPITELFLRPRTADLRPYSVSAVATAAELTFTAPGESPLSLITPSCDSETGFSSGVGAQISVAATRYELSFSAADSNRSNNAGHDFNKREQWSIASVVSSSAILRTLQHDFSTLYARTPTLPETARVWAAFVTSLRADDELTNDEAAALIAMTHAAPASAPPVDTAIVLQRARARLAEMMSACRSVNCGAALSCSAETRALTVLLPVFDETVLFTTGYLSQRQTGLPSDVDNATKSDLSRTSVLGGVRPLEFLVSRHKSEWNNLAERIGVTVKAQASSSYTNANSNAISKDEDDNAWVIDVHGVKLTSSRNSVLCTSVLPPDGITSAAWMLLQWFLAQPLSASPEPSVSATVTATAASLANVGSPVSTATASAAAIRVAATASAVRHSVCVWASLRGQTLYRTVRGFDRIRALSAAAHQLEHSDTPLSSTQVNAGARKVQVLVAAQVLGERTAARGLWREGMRALLRDFPAVETVYPSETAAETAAAMAATTTAWRGRLAPHLAVATAASSASNDSDLGWGSGLTLPVLTPLPSLAATCVASRITPLDAKLTLAHTTALRLRYNPLSTLVNRAAGETNVSVTTLTSVSAAETGAHILAAALAKDAAAFSALPQVSGASGLAFVLQAAAAQGAGVDTVAAAWPARAAVIAAATARAVTIAQLQARAVADAVALLCAAHSSAVAANASTDAADQDTVMRTLQTLSSNINNANGQNSVNCTAVLESARVGNSSEVNVGSALLGLAGALRLHGAGIASLMSAAIGAGASEEEAKVPTSTATRPHSMLVSSVNGNDGNDGKTASSGTVQELAEFLTDFADNSSLSKSSIKAGTALLDVVQCSKPASPAVTAASALADAVAALAAAQVASIQRVGAAARAAVEVAIVAKTRQAQTAATATLLLHDIAISDGVKHRPTLKHKHDFNDCDQLLALATAAEAATRAAAATLVSKTAAIVLSTILAGTQAATAAVQAGNVSLRSCVASVQILLAAAARALVAVASAADSAVAAAAVNARALGHVQLRTRSDRDKTATITAQTLLWREIAARAASVLINAAETEVPAAVRAAAGATASHAIASSNIIEAGANTRQAQRQAGPSDVQSEQLSADVAVRTASSAVNAATLALESKRGAWESLSEMLRISVARAAAAISDSVIAEKTTCDGLTSAFAACGHVERERDAHEGVSARLYRFALAAVLVSNKDLMTANGDLWANLVDDSTNLKNAALALPKLSLTQGTATTSALALPSNSLLALALAVPAPPAISARPAALDLGLPGGTPLPSPARGAGPLYAQQSYSVSHNAQTAATAIAHDGAWALPSPAVSHTLFAPSSRVTLASAVPPAVTAVHGHRGTVNAKTEAMRLSAMAAHELEAIAVTVAAAQAAAAGAGLRALLATHGLSDMLPGGSNSISSSINNDSSVHSHSDALHDAEAAYGARALSTAVLAVTGHAHWSVHATAARSPYATRDDADSISVTVPCAPSSAAPHTAAAALSLCITAAAGESGARPRTATVALTSPAATALASSTQTVAAAGGLTTLAVLGRVAPLVLGRGAFAAPNAGSNGTLPLPTTNAKSDNQSHALVFARGDIIQAIDMNQDLGWEAAAMMRRMMSELKYLKPRYSLSLAGSVGLAATATALGTFVNSNNSDSNKVGGWRGGIMALFARDKLNTASAPRSILATSPTRSTLRSAAPSTSRALPRPRNKPAPAATLSSSASSSIEMTAVSVHNAGAAASATPALPATLAWPWTLPVAPQSATEQPQYLLVGCPEHIYTEPVSHLAGLMAAQETAFGTIVQRVLRYTGGRLHYGHPDLFDGLWVRAHSGLSKASPESNLSEDVFFALDALQRLPTGIGAARAPPNHAAANDSNFDHGNGARKIKLVPVPRAGATFVEYLRVGKGRDVGLHSTTVFQNKISRGAGTMLRAPDLHRLSGFAVAGADGGGSGGGGTALVAVASAFTGVFSSIANAARSNARGSGGSAATNGGLDAVTALSVQMGGPAHYAYTLLFDWAVSSYVWVLLALAAAHVDAETVGLLGSVYAIPWLLHLGYAAGLPLLAHLVLTRGAVRGTATFAANFITGMPYYIFLMRAKAAAFAAVVGGLESGALGTAASAPLAATATITVSGAASGNTKAAESAATVGAGTYVGTGRTLPLAPQSFLELYTLYARSHAAPALSLLAALLAYIAVLVNYAAADDTSLGSTAARGPARGYAWGAVALQTHAVVVALLCWLITPALYNPLAVSPQLSSNSGGNSESKAVTVRTAVIVSKTQVAAVVRWTRRGFEPLDSDTDIDDSSSNVDANASRRSCLAAVLCVKPARLQRLRALYTAETVQRAPGSAWATWWWRARRSDLSVRAASAALAAAKSPGRCCVGACDVISSAFIAVLGAAPWLLLALLLLSSLAQAGGAGGATGAVSLPVTLAQTAAAAVVAAVIAAAAARAHSHGNARGELVVGRRDSGSAAALALAMLGVIAALLAALAAVAGVGVGVGSTESSAVTASGSLWAALAALRWALWATALTLIALAVAAVSVTAAALQIADALTVRKVAVAAAAFAWRAHSNADNNSDHGDGTSASATAVAAEGPAGAVRAAETVAAVALEAAAPWGCYTATSDSSSSSGSAVRVRASAAAVVVASPWGAPYRWVTGELLPIVTAAAHAAVTVTKIAVLRLTGSGAL